MTRAAIVNITMFSDEPPSLIRKATSAPCAIPDSANREDMLRAIFIIEPPIFFDSAANAARPSPPRCCYRTSKPAAREKLARQHIYVNPRARSPEVNQIRARASGMAAVFGAARQVLRPPRSIVPLYGVVRRLLWSARSGVRS